MSILSDTVRGVGRLLFPVRCPVCGGKMPPGSRVVCTRCRYAVPLTGFCYATYNPLWERLSALVPVEQASAFLYFIPGSGWRELIHRFKYDGAWRLARDMGVWYGHCLADSGLYDTVDRIVPVPLHWRKRLRRGYNQAEYLAEGIARATPSGGTTSRESSPYAVPKGSRGTISCWWTTCSLRAPHCSHAPRRSCAPRPTAG